MDGTSLIWAAVPHTSDGDVTPVQQEAQAKASFHAAIVANFERMQSELATLLTRWRDTPPDPSEFDEDADEESDN